MEVRIGAPSFLDAHREKRVTSLDAIEGCPPIFDSCVPFDLGRQAKVHGGWLDRGAKANARKIRVDEYHPLRDP
jgi:hypothetical protein